MTGIITAEGYTSLLIVLLMGMGIIMLSIGIIGSYIWRIYDATRNRPPFIIDEPMTPKTSMADTQTALPKTENNKRTALHISQTKDKAYLNKENHKRPEMI